MDITFPQENVTIPLYMSGTISCSDTSSPTQQQLDYCPRLVLTSPHDWDPHSFRFPKGPYSKEEEYLFSGIAEICVDKLQSKVNETEIESSLRDNVHNLSFIVT